tara:strand:- start:1542 stop:3116 length:1575 start_codon:yes stop_codon:yes gene_type:complete
MQENTNLINDGEIDLLSVWNSLVREKFLILFLTVLSSSSAILYTYLVQPIWSGSFNIVVKKNEQTGTSFSTNKIISSLVGGDNSQNRTEEIILRSPLVLMPVFDYVKNYYNQNKINTENLSFSEWSENELKVGFQDNSQILKVSYKNTDKDHILKTLNLISKKYQNYSKRDREKSINKTISYLKDQREIMSFKALKSQKELNTFSIDNGLGSIDGFVEIGSGINNFKKLLGLGNNGEFLKSNTLGGLSLGSSEGSNAGQRFSSQYALLEKYETQYINLSAKLKPNSETLETLKIKIDNLRSSLKRPNEILIKYRELSKQSRRDNILLQEIEDNLEIMKLEKIKSPDPWELISQPVINPGRVFPNRKLITIISFISSLLISSSFALLKQKKSGFIYELDELKRFINLKYLDKIYINNINLSLSIILKTIEISSLEDINVSSKSLTGLSIYTNRENNDFINKLITNNKIAYLDITNEEDTKKFDKLIIFINKGISLKDLELLNKYIFINSKKLIGWFYIDSETTFK